MTYQKSWRYNTNLFDALLKKNQNFQNFIKQQKFF